MKLTVNDSNWKRFFSVPCALVDNYLELADGAALKVILYLMSSEEQPDEQKIIAATGITKEAFDEAVMFWRELGVISTDGQNSAVTEIPAASEPVKKVVHSRYAPKDIAELVKVSPELRELFSEAESTLGRVLKHPDHELLISMRDYYGFSEQSIVLLLSYCAERGKTSTRYCESIVKELHDKGILDFHSIEQELERRREYNSFENEIRRDFGLDIKLTPRQKQYITSWREMGFGIDMISIARERCFDNINKLSFQYIDSIIKSWKNSGIFTPEAAENEIKPSKQKDAERSFDLDEFDRFTLDNTSKETK